MTASYGPGTWLGILRGRTAVLLESDTSPELVQTLWELLAGNPQVHEVLHAVTTGFGGSLTDMPSFGIIDFRDSLRVFLRGDLDLEIDGSGDLNAQEGRTGPVELNGRNVSTWAERWLAEPGGFRLSTPGAPDASWPIVEGVVLMGTLSVTADGEARLQAVAAATPDAAVAAAPAAAPAAAEAPTVAVPDLETPDLEVPGLDAPELDSAAIAAAAAPPVVESPAPEEPAAEPALEAPALDEPAVESAVLEPASGEADAAYPAVDREVSAETMMGLSDEDLDYTVAPADLHIDEQESDGAEGQKPESDAVDPAVDVFSEPAHEMTTNYDHLWEKTVARSIEDAAVRDDPEEDEEPAAAPAEDVPEAEEPEEPAPAPAQASVSAPPALQPPAGSGLIDSVPWQTSNSPAAPPAPQAPQPMATPGPGWPVPGAPQPGYPASSFDDDHDGQTIMKSDLAGMVAHPAPVVAAEPASGPLVLARVCAQGHANPPTNAQCAACGQELPADAIQVPRPKLGVMRISTGEVVELDQSLVIGRQPSVSRVQGNGMPRLVQVASPSGDISRSHVEVRLEGWHVMLCDLKATNGTVLVRQGQPPRRLAQNEMAILLDGDIAELGDDISLRFEEIL